MVMGSTNFTIFCWLEARHMSAHTQGSGSFKGVIHGGGVPVEVWSPRPGVLVSWFPLPSDDFFLDFLVPLCSQISRKPGLPGCGTCLDVLCSFIPTSMPLARIFNATFHVHLTPQPSYPSAIHFVCVAAANLVYILPLSYSPCAARARTKAAVNFAHLSLFFFQTTSLRMKLTTPHLTVPWTHGPGSLWIFTDSLFLRHNRDSLWHLLLPF